MHFAVCKELRLTVRNRRNLCKCSSKTKPHCRTIVESSGSFRNDVMTVQIWVMIVIRLFPLAQENAKQSCTIHSTLALISSVSTHLLASHFRWTFWVVVGTSVIIFLLLLLFLWIGEFMRLAFQFLTAGPYTSSR